MSEPIKKLILYIVLTLVFVTVAVSVYAGINPSKFLQTFHQTFEPGKLALAGTQEQIEQTAKFGCSGTFYIVTLDETEFRYIPKGSEQEIEFVVALTYNGRMFLGRDADSTNGDPVLRCGLENNEFACWKKRLEFGLEGVSTPTGTRILHFTAWQANKFVVDDIKEAEDCRGASGCKNFADILDSYSDFYLSSFDIRTDVGKKCREAACSGKPESDCKATEGCYWGGLFSNSCSLCPSHGADCTKYTREQCAQCAEPKANCKPTGVLSFNGCEAK